MLIVWYCEFKYKRDCQIFYILTEILLNDKSTLSFVLKDLIGAASSNKIQLK